MRQGQVVAYVGATGLASGPHLHYEVWLNGQRVNPIGAKVPQGTILAGSELASFKSQKSRIDRMLAEGHGVQLHAFAHIRHTKLSEEIGAADTDRALSTLASLGVEPDLWRTPWGVTAEWTERVAAARGLELVRWTADTHDWRGDTAAEMLAAIEDDVADGAIVLAHDALGPGATRDGCAETVDLIAPLVALARSRGLEPVALAPGRCPEAACR